jgi:type II secretory pathway pseudopilin PulG
MIVLGLLAAIAVPVFLSQRGKAHDTATKADVSSFGKELVTYWIGATTPPVLDYSTPGSVRITDGSTTTYARLTVGSRAPLTGSSSDLDQPQGWCVALTDSEGSVKTFKYTALDGLGTGSCP